MAEPLSLDFTLPFADAIAHARKRGVMLPEVYYSEAQSVARRAAFTVSGLTALDQIERVRDSLTAAMSGGLSFRDWQATATAERLSYTLPPGRVETIFRTNVQTAYSQGHWRDFVEQSSFRPFLMYSAVNDSRTRPAHKAMSGHIAWINDAIWKKWTPPCGYNCRCSLLALSPKEALARGYGKQVPPAVDPDEGFGGADPRDLLPSTLKIVLERRASQLPSVLAKALRGVVEPPPLVPPTLPPAAPPPVPPTAPPVNVPPPADPRPWLKWTHRPEALEWSTRAWTDNMREDLARVVEKVGPPRTVTKSATDYGYYNRGRQQINMHDSYDPAQVKHQAIWSHEFGHWTDNKLAGGMDFRSGQHDFIAAVSNDAADMKLHFVDRETAAARRVVSIGKRVENGETTWGTARDELAASLKIDPADLDKMLRRHTEWYGENVHGKAKQLTRLFIAIEERAPEYALDALRGFGMQDVTMVRLHGQLGNYSDMIGSATLNKVGGTRWGFGHRDSYYGRMDDRTAEVFANLFALWADGSQVFRLMARAMMPETASLFESIMAGAK